MSPFKVDYLIIIKCIIFKLSSKLLTVCLTYFLQDEGLSDEVRALSGTPLLFISHGALTLENPSRQTRWAADNNLSLKLAPSTHQREALKLMKKDAFGEETVVKKKRKHKVLQGPNPLSCKKKRKTQTQNTQRQTDSKVKGKRKRHKKKKNQNSLTNISS